MKVIGGVSDQLKNYLHPAVDLIKKRLFGSNNERLDFLMDSFYKLSSNHQKGVILGIIGAVALVVMGAFAIYFSRVTALESELNQGFEALQELRALGGAYRAEQENFDTLVKSIGRKTQELKPKPFFEQMANQVGVKLENLRSDETEFNQEHPMAKQFKMLSVEFRLPKVSIPKMLMFLGEVEKADKTLSVSNLQIRARYGDRLYFDVSAKVTGYLVGSSR